MQMSKSDQFFDEREAKPELNYLCVFILFQVLNDLYHLLRFETCKSIHRAFEVVLSAMDRHLRVKHMQISGRFVLNQ